MYSSTFCWFNTYSQLSVFIIKTIVLEYNLHQGQVWPSIIRFMNCNSHRVEIILFAFIFTQYSYFTPGVHNSNLKRAKKISVKIDIFTHSEGVFSSKQADAILGYAGHINSFSGPHLTHRPYVVH